MRPRAYRRRRGGTVESGVFLGVSCVAGFACAFMFAAAAEKGISRAYAAVVAHAAASGEVSIEDPRALAVLLARYYVRNGVASFSGFSQAVTKKRCRSAHFFGCGGAAEASWVGCVVRKRGVVVRGRLLCFRGHRCRGVQDAPVGIPRSALSGSCNVGCRVSRESEGAGVASRPGSRCASVHGGVPACGVVASSSVF